MPAPVKKTTKGNLHKGYGKVILFGEHVVVHGAPAVVAGVAEYTECQLDLLPGQPGLQVVDNRPAIPGYKEEKRAEQKAAHDLVLKHLKIDLSRDGLRMTIGGPLVPSSGIGASASDVVAFSRALSDLYGLKLTEHQVNESAFVGEGGYHGTPSGVDNTAATFGGLIEYRRTSSGPKFSAISGKGTLFLVVASTGITASTTKVVGEVRALKDKDPSWWKQSVIKPYEKVYKDAIKAFAAGDLAALGRELDANHTICQTMTVSCPELDDIVTQARQLGALGAKMSGTGRGGLTVALASSEAEQRRIAEGLKSCKSVKYVWTYNVVPRASSKL